MHVAWVCTPDLLSQVRSEAVKDGAPKDFALAHVGRLRELDVNDTRLTRRESLHAWRDDKRVIGPEKKKQKEGEKEASVKNLEEGEREANEQRGGI